MNNEIHSTSSEEAKNGHFSRVFRGCFIALVTAFLICMLAVVAVVGFVIAGAVIGATAAPERAQAVRLREVHLSGPVKAPKIAVINVQGMLYGSSTPSVDLTPVAIISAKLERARRDPQVKGVLLFVDSGGGRNHGRRYIA